MQSPWLITNPNKVNLGWNLSLPYMMKNIKVHKNKENIINPHVAITWI